MAELTMARRDDAGCCSAEAQRSCCEATAKASCCGEASAEPGGACGCSAGAPATAEAPGPDVRELVRRRYAAAATTLARGEASETSEVFGAAALYDARARKPEA